MDTPFDKLQFTMRREYEKAKEEAELIRQLRTVSSIFNFVSLLCELFHHLFNLIDNPITAKSRTTGRSIISFERRCGIVPFCQSYHASFGG